MKHGRTISTYAKALVGILGLLAVICAPAQSPQPTQPRTVPLVSDSCPSVRIGDKISFDLNPLFDPIWPVTGLRGFGLEFLKVADDGVHLNRQFIHLIAGNTPTSISPLGNGYFHIEVSMGKRSIAPGIYRLVRAEAVAEVQTDYNGPNPTMMVSPVRERSCITVVSSTASQSPQPGS